MTTTIRHRAWQESDQAENTIEPEATNGIRFKAACCLALGLPLCFTPLTVVGVPLALFGFFTLLFTPALEKVETQARQGWRDEQAQGRDGCAWFLWSCILGAVLIIGAAFLASALTLALTQGGQ